MAVLFYAVMRDPDFYLVAPSTLSVWYKITLLPSSRMKEQGEEELAS